ncbi:MAG: C-terminal helicase domain-containing protein [bacterium]|nr:C-terminal helicase domain-containing protein [bacterium]
MRFSLQHLADRVNPFGTMIRLGGGEDLWVGCPLRVHRRCLDPMFSLANQIAYNGHMVQQTASIAPLDHLPQSLWVDCTSNLAQEHWIPQQGAEMVSFCRQLLGMGVAPTDIFVISPFKSVSKQVETLIRRHGDLTGLQSGTIHTFQGKEAPIVLLLLGGNPERPGAMAWASERPNVLNVALTRAQHRFYVIGDRNLWRRYPHFDQLDRQLPPSELQVTFNE